MVNTLVETPNIDFQVAHSMYAAAAYAIEFLNTSRDWQVITHDEELGRCHVFGADTVDRTFRIVAVIQGEQVRGPSHTLPAHTAAIIGIGGWVALPEAVQAIATHLKTQTYIEADAR